MSINKMVVSFLLLAIVTGGAIVLSGFFGLPWERVKAQSVITEFVEDKYEIDTKKIDTYFNFKDGKYGVELKTEDDITFKAEWREDLQVIDYYPEAIWKKQMEDDLLKEVQVIFPDHKFIVFDGAYGVGRDEIKGKEIGNYKEIPTDFFLSIRLQEKWKSNIEDKTAEQLLHLVEIIQEKNISNMHVTLYFDQTDDKVSFDSISIPAIQIKPIQTKEDILQYSSGGPNHNG
ncbi:hypothetical protein [Bacillus alkalicellulosilyticus]|uniref:YfjL-like protein n=1 Tax=Alkalihalobacterium alkalicellulosilyticum TaxID=1912214 RepID=UPI0009984E12|nr:hypothetical protein [Bacillus alkalicellulosilyticus]